MPVRYARFWKATFAVAAAAVFWDQAGHGLYRRMFLPQPAAPEAVRTQRFFSAVVFPRITEDGEGYTLSQQDFEGILKGLRSLGYVTVGLKDVEAFYLDKKAMPRRALVILFDREEPRSIALADEVLARQRMRAAVFLNDRDQRSLQLRRRWLSDHAVAQLRRSGTWDFGRAVGAEADRPAEDFSFATREGEFRFAAAKTGFNDDRQNPRALSAMPVHPRASVPETLLMLHGDQPRKGGFTDKFDNAGLAKDWIAGWGVVARSHGRLVIVPTPRQTSASVSLLGTEAWKDMSLEFRLERFRRGFWAYARYKDSGHYVRVGATDGHWVLQHKAGPRAPISVLGRVPIRKLPAEVRMVVKGDSVLLYVDGTMQFGRSFRVPESIDRGRIQLDVFDQEPRQAAAVLGWVRAAPLGHQWLAMSPQAVTSQESLEPLRNVAVEAGVMSPLWLSVEPGGGVAAAETDRDLTWSFAGYYRCRLIPTVDLTRWSGASDAAKAAALAAELAASVKRLGVRGLNLRMASATVPGTDALLENLRGRLRVAGAELWVTVPGGASPAWVRRADGVLRAVGKPGPGLELLKVDEAAAAEAGREARRVR